jgi:hypothetical protein
LQPDTTNVWGHSEYKTMSVKVYLNQVNATYMVEWHIKKWMHDISKIDSAYCHCKEVTGSCPQVECTTKKWKHHQHSEYY